MAFCIQESQAGGASMMEPMDVDEGGGEALTEGRERQEGVGGHPAHWVRMSRDKPTVAINLSMESEEFNTVLMFFLASFSRHGVDVQRIFRIQSTFLWKHYVLKGEEMKQDHAGKEVEQRLLFHGTSCSHVDGICRKGFDWRLSARTKYGHGCYFACKSSFSHGYSPCTEPRLDFPQAVQSALSPPSSSSSPHHTSSSSASSPSSPHPLNPADPGTVGSHTPEGFQRQQQQQQQQGSENMFGFHQPWLSSATPGSAPWRPTASYPYPPPPSPSPSLQQQQQQEQQQQELEAKGPGGLRYMFVAQVLVGNSVRGNSSYRRPPAMLPGDPNGPSFDSCVDSEQDPAIFIIFDSNQAYPEYLLEYTCSKD